MSRHWSEIGPEFEEFEDTVIDLAFSYEEKRHELRENIDDSHPDKLEAAREFVSADAALENHVIERLIFGLGGYFPGHAKRQFARCLVNLLQQFQEKESDQ